MLYGWTLFFAVIFTILATSHGGLWGNWTPWTACSVTCGFGIQTRIRHCTDNEKLRCVYFNETEEISCAAEQMWCDPINGGWGSWKAWSNCSRRCGVGSRWRQRSCSNPKPAYGGTHCEGEVQEAENCEMAICPPLYDGVDAIACGHGEVLCATGKQCIKEWHRCNWYYDCWDGSDESACAPGEPVVILNLSTASRNYSTYIQSGITLAGMIWILVSSSLS